MNYALHGTDVRGYHVLNLVIHLLAGLTLFGIVHRTLPRPVFSRRVRVAALPLAFSTAVIWVVHPLQTESVTYISQRAESTMGLFYLLTLYCAIRGADSDQRSVWCVLSVVCCLLGDATKEVIVSAPLIVFLYDRTFLFGSFREAWQQRWRLYSALAATWILLGYLVISTGNRGGSAGLGTHIQWRAYALTQLWAVPHYLRLSFWPDPLVFDYGMNLRNNIAQILPGALIVAGMLLGTAIMLRRWPMSAFLGAWFLLILAPTSSVLPVATQTVAEHRMYLPLAAVIAMVVVGGYASAPRLMSHRQQPIIVSIVSVGLIVLLTTVTIRRNQDYMSELRIWQDTVSKCPDNPRAYYNLGVGFSRKGQFNEEIHCYEQALRIKPDYAEAHYNLGVTLVQLGELQDAARHFEVSLRVWPEHAEAQNNLGVVLMRLGKPGDAIPHFEESLRLWPGNAEANCNLGHALAQTGDVADAIRYYERALRFNPDYVPARRSLERLRAGH